MHPKKIIIFSLFIILLITSCSSKGTSQNISFPGINIPPEEMNSSVQLWDDPISANTYKDGDVLDLRIKNLSNKTILLENDSEVKIFTKQNQSWKIIQNTMGSSSGEITLPPQSIYPPGADIVILPEIMNIKEQVTIYVVITGHYEDDPNKFTGSYIAIKINP